MSKSKGSNKPDVMENIAEILGVLEEKNLSKDWLLGELKRHKIKTEISVFSNSYQILKNCNPEKIQKIIDALKEDLVIKDVKTLTRTLHWFFIDIVSSSDPNLPVKSQARKIYALNELIQRTDTFKKERLEYLDILTTGDGMAIGFSDSPEKPLRLAIELHKALRKFNSTQKEKDKIIIRIGIDTGPVYFMKGIKGEIFWGPGLIMAKRVMDLCGPNQIFASERIAKDLRSLSEENKATMHPIGEYEIKYGKLSIYNIFSKEFGNKAIPKKGKIVKSIEDNFKQPNFEFNSVEVRLEITDSKSMMSHHTWIWDVKNTSKNPLTAIYYSLGGDLPKDFPDLNVKITDEKDNRLEIMSLEVNKPLDKAFYVKLAIPIRKNQSGRLVKLEYDWEEPDRNFAYTFSSKSKKFRYFFTAPKDLQIKHRILESVKDLGVKIRAEPPANVKYHDDRTEIVWETANKHKIQAHDTFEFQW
ncbi:MAG: adenylate/guanylate cyclase domain-containing protein [Nitrosarchaeum sp.]